MNGASPSPNRGAKAPAPRTPCAPETGETCEDSLGHDVTLAQLGGLALLLIDGLVPVAIIEISRESPADRLLVSDKRIRLAEEAADVIACSGDSLTSGRDDKLARAGRRRLLVAVARGLATMAYWPGGVTWQGRHWEALP